jgi:hypothetical protein
MENPLLGMNMARKFMASEFQLLVLVASIAVLTAMLLLVLGSACDSSNPGSTLAAPSNSISPPPRLQAEDRVYPVGRRLRDFPEKEDLSTPEAAVASYRRAYVRGDSLRPYLVKRHAALQPSEPSGKPLPEVHARSWLNQEIIEVQIHEGNSAAVFSWQPGFWGAYFDATFLELHKGNWLRDGSHESDSIHIARADFANWCRYRDREAARRAPVKNPERHLEPFVSFLRAEGEDPQAFVLDALAKHRLVIMGEVHHRPQYWAFNTSLVQAASFPRNVGVIYLELPSADQAMVDEFLSSSRLDPQPVVEMMRDMLWPGWPDQPTLDFFISVWKVNQSLAPEQKLRIVLVDPRAAWRDVHQREDAVAGEVSRDREMADIILQDLQAHRHDPRHGLFIVGVMHARLGWSHYNGHSWVTSGSRLRTKLGPQAVYAIHQHRPVRFSYSERTQRPALGLFDTAFAALDCRPIAFPLTHGPFGQLPLDDFQDGWPETTDSYRDAFSAYLYLGPLENETFSPLIPGFYTDEFVRELDRRSRLLKGGKGLVERIGLARLDGASVTAWQSETWGKPRASWSAARLGPITRWHQGLPEDTED